MKLDDAIGFIINKTGRGLMLLLNHELIQHGITSEQWTLLKRLEEQDGISLKELSIRVGKDQANVTRICELLIQRGLVSKQQNKEDKRSFLMYLTTEGQSLVELLIPIDEKLQEMALKNISEEELAVFKKVISKINENVNL